MSEIQVPYLSEHEAPKGSQSQAPGYRPSDEERKTIELVEKLYSRAKKYRKRYDSRWIDFYKMFRGRQWKETRPAYRHSEVVNLVFQTIESMIPILTDSKPKLEYLPTVPGQFELADILNKVADNDWTQNNWLMELCALLLDGHLYGTGFMYCGYDDEANLGLGNILAETWDPFFCFPDPDARKLNDRRGKFFIYAEPVALSKLKKEYRDKAQYLTSDVVDLAQGDKADIYQVMFKSPVDSKLIVEGPSGYDSVGKDQALKLTCYYKDDEMEELEETEFGEDGTPILDELGQPQKKFVQKLKYPNGRKICIASGVLLEDGPMEFEDGQIPASMYVNYLLPREFWGMGDVEQLESPQKMFNKILSYALDVMSLMGNPIWVVGTEANIDTDNLFNKPGLIVEADNIDAIRREEGVNLQPFVLQLLDRFKSYHDTVSGQTDLSRGAEPEEVTAASAISALQNAQQTRLRMKSRHLDAFLQDFGRQYLSRVFQFYSVPRIVRVSGDDDAAAYFHFHVEKLQKPDGTMGMFANVVTYDELGQPLAKKHEITGDFDVKVSTGSTLPFAKDQKFAQSMHLFKAGIIDPEEVLKNIEYPNYEAVLARVAQAKQAEMESQMAMQEQQMAMKQQGSAPPPMGGPPQGP